jgi:hypothetical protein
MRRKRRSALHDLHLAFFFTATVIGTIDSRMKTSIVGVMALLLVGCAGGASTGEDTAALGDTGGVKGIFRFAAATTGEFSTASFPGDGSFTGEIGSGNTVTGNIRENPAGHFTLKFDGVSGSPCARLNAASVVAEGWVHAGGLALRDLCGNGGTYSMSANQNF